MMDNNDYVYSDIELNNIIQTLHDQELNDALIKSSDDIHFCSADGNVNILCNNYATLILPCNHKVCDFHITNCYACHKEKELAARIIQRTWYRYILIKKIHYIAIKRIKAVMIIRKYWYNYKLHLRLRDIYRQSWKAKFLDRF